MKPLQTPFKLILLLTSLICMKCVEDVEPCQYEFQLIGEHSQFGTIGNSYFDINNGGALLAQLQIANKTIYLGDYEYFFEAPELEPDYEDTLYIFNPINISLNLLEDSSFELRYFQSAFHRNGRHHNYGDSFEEPRVEGAGFDFDGFSIDSVRYGTWTKILDNQLELISGNWIAHADIIIVNDGDSVLFTIKYRSFLDWVDVGRDPDKPIPTKQNVIRRKAGSAFYLKLRQVSQDSVFFVPLYSGMNLPECAFEGPGFGSYVGFN